MAKKYTDEHEWVEKINDVWRVGITDYAQEQLGDVVMVELPEVGRAVAKGEECAAIESVKAASDIYSPATGEIVAINGALEDSPALVNESAENEGWLFDMKIADESVLDGLMDAAAYKTFTEEA